MTMPDTASVNAADDALEDQEAMTIARVFIDQRYKWQSWKTLVKWRDEFYVWKESTGYAKVSPKVIDDELWLFIPTLQAYEAGRGGRRRLTKIHPNCNLVRNVLTAVGAQTRWDGAFAPAWLDLHRPDPRDIIAFRNGILRVSEFVENGVALLMPPTPAWFSTTILPYDFVPNARCPRWITFIGEVLGGDDSVIALVQEWFGYCLTPDTRMQKLMFLLGLPGSGKGTMIRVLTSLIGIENCATPTLSALTSPFGLHSLLNRSAAMIADAHLGGRDDKTGVLDRILAITGEDSVDVHRKYLEPLNAVRIGARFTIGVNRIPSMPDASNAMLRRMLVVPFRGSFVDRVDVNLTDALLAELPGIAHWALNGLVRLRTQGRFTVTAAAAKPIEMFRRSSSPVMAFVDDRCVIGAELKVPCDELWDAWKKWCDENGHEKGSKNSFGVNLHAAIEINRERKGSRGLRAWHYIGIGMKVEGFEDEEGDESQEVPDLF